MRLLNVETFKFEEFFYKTPPSYAILSHTWGDDSEEVSYLNVLAGRLDSAETRPEKVSGCCSQARNDGFKYVWIDTCCIDKTNLVELTEAINSMFRWYREAAICYVYLVDVPPGDEIHDPASRFHGSRWFQRGWTLQELLAPLHLRFYDATWKCLGTKGDLCDAIEKITGIPSPYLLGINDLHYASIAQRMSWAAKRITKREEDIAYCLLGIFDIVMSMIYGEGPNAFRRLQEQIMLRNTSDDSILAWGLFPQTPPDFSSALADHPSRFAFSGQIVSRPRPGADSIDVRSGTVRLHLRLVSRPDGQASGALRCGPEHDPQMAVCLPLSHTPGGEEGEYSRTGGTCAVLERIPDSNQIRISPCRIRVDGKTRQSTATSQTHYFHIQRSPAVRDLDIIDVHPAERWHKERSLIEATAVDGDSVQRAVVRLRDHNSEASDFVVVLEAVPDGPSLRAQCHLMTASKNTPLKDITQLFDDTEWLNPLGKTATNSAFTLQAILEPEPKQRKFDLRLDKLSDPPVQTTNVTFELERRKRATEIECLTQVRQAVRDEHLLATQALEREQSVMRGIMEELHGVEQELLIMLERKKQLVSKSEAQDLVLHNLRETQHKKEQKLATLKSWAQTAEDQLDGFVNNKAPGADKGVKTRQHVLPLAAQEGYEDLVGALIEKGTPMEDLIGKDWRPLHHAISNGHVNIARMLIDEGADIEVLDETGWTPLHTAAQSGNTTMVRYLLDKGADKDALTNSGSSPLHKAAWKGREGVVRLLLERGAKMTANSLGWLAIHFAARNGFVSVVRLFLDRGVDVESKGPDDMTPLHCAASGGHNGIISLLLERGASPVRLTRSGISVLEKASQNGHENTVQLLRESGAVLAIADGDGAASVRPSYRDSLESSRAILDEEEAQSRAQAAEFPNDQESEGPQEPEPTESEVIWNRPNAPRVSKASRKAQRSWKDRLGLRGSRVLT